MWDTGYEIRDTRCGIWNVKSEAAYKSCLGYKEPGK